MDINIFYATVTGNSEDAAGNIGQELSSAGHKVNVENMADIDIYKIAESKNVIVVTSTWGDGEPPMPAQEFYEDFMSSDMDLSGVKYCVFGLGESYYENFCKAAIDFDNKFSVLGGQRFLELEKADGEADEYLKSWIPKVINALK